MNKKDIGNLVNYERTKKKISLQELADGLCSTSALQRLESGERLPDFFVLERVIERLGRSVNKIELLYHEATYEIFYLREIIERYLEQENYGEMVDALLYYESLPESKEPLHWQYICKMRAVIAQKKHDHNEAICLLEEAIRQTVFDFDWKKLDKHPFGEGELVLLLMWLQEKIETDTPMTEMDETKILQYIRRNYEDEEVLANIYSKAMWVLGNVALKTHRPQDALQYALQAERILVENGLLLHLPQFLERILELLRNTDQAAYVEWKKQRDALKWVYEEYGVRWETGQIELWRNYRQQEVYLFSELFGQERKVINHSQEKLADVLEIDQKTISRIESGKYKPKPGTFQKMKEYLQINRDICSTRIVVDDFSLLELEREIAKKNYYRNNIEGEKLYMQLKPRLSMKWNENCQYVKFMDTLFAKERELITDEEAVEQCLEAFRITRKNIDFEQLDQIVLNRTEALIINYIALCCDKMGDRERAIRLKEKAVWGYENSKVMIKYHYVSVSLFYENLSNSYEKCGRLQEAMDVCEKGIRYELECGRGLTLGFYVDQKAYIAGQITGDIALGKRDYRQAYQLHKLMRKESSMKRLQTAYERIFNEKID